MTQVFDPIECLPHRAPALILERVEVGGDGAVESLFTPRIGDHYVEDARLCLGGVVEAMAQAAAAHLGLENRDRGRDPSTPGLLVGLEALTVTRLPKVEETVRVRCEVTQSFGASLWVEAVTTVEGSPCARGILKVFTLGDDAGDR